MWPRADRAEQKFLTLWHYMNDPLIFGVSKRVWSKLSDDDQTLLKQAAIDAGAWEIEKSRSELDATLQAIRERGVEVTELTPEQHQAFVAATQKVYEKWTPPRIGKKTG